MLNSYVHFRKWRSAVFLSCILLGSSKVFVNWIHTCLHTCPLVLQTPFLWSTPEICWETFWPGWASSLCLFPKQIGTGPCGRIHKASNVWRKWSNGLKAYHFLYTASLVLRVCFQPSLTFSLGEESTSVAAIWERYDPIRGNASPSQFADDPQGFPIATQRIELQVTFIREWDNKEEEH